MKINKLGAGAFGRCAGLLFTVTLLSLPQACSTSTTTGGPQCENDTDCVGLEPNTSCSADKVCVEPGASGECLVNMDCISRDPNTICRKSDFTCVPVKTAECATVEGDFSRDDALMIGSVLPLTGLEEMAGKPIDLGIKLALHGIDKELMGIPAENVGQRRPIVHIGCDSKSDPSDETQIKGAKHLAETLRVPAIIGEAFSRSTVAIANNVTIKNDTLLLSPAAMSDDISTLVDNDLVWRTSPPDAVQVDALKLYVPEVEVMVRADFDANMAPINTPVKVAILHNTDPYEIARADALISDMPTPALAVNGKAITDPSNAPYYMRKQYDETDGAAQQTLADEMASAFQPHIIVLFGFSQGTTLLTLIEAQWPANVMRPRYVLPSSMARGDLTAAVGADDALRKRITGTIPGTWNGPPFETFLDDYEFKWVADAETYPGATLGAAGGYDAVFLLAYATATFGDKPVSGKDLADGLKKLSSPTGPVINASAKGVPPGFAALRDMGSIDYNGASGPLDFNPATGEAQSDIQVWCLASFNSQIIQSGLYYETAAKSMGGSVSSACQ